MKQKQYLPPAIAIHRIEMEGLIAQTARVRVIENGLQYNDYTDIPAETDGQTKDVYITF
ncbi:MAG: hypothetical protein LBB85_04100 [Dysgonamonadaceae bacterium]|jgi:hypothetical protein|nr:hypothetical protein [Dysgonamonadaceae bacterium]